MLSYELATMPSKTLEPWEAPVPPVSQNYSIENAQNYGVVYRFRFEGGMIKSNDDDINVKVKCSSEINPNLVLKNSEAGCYVAVCTNAQDAENFTYFSTILGRVQDYDQSRVVEKYVTCDNNGTFLTVKQNEPVEFYVVVSGMSSMPVEITFE